MSGVKRSDKVRKIGHDYSTARSKGKDHSESIIYAVEQNPDNNSDLFVEGIYPLHSLSLKVDSTQKQKALFGEVKYLGGKEMWRIDKHRIAVDFDKYPDHRIITVTRIIKGLDGKPRKYRVQAFAVGADALEAITPRQKVIKGIEKEIADYEQKGHDQNLKRRLAEAKRRRARQIQ